MELMAEWQWKRWDAVARLGAGKLTVQEAARVLRLSVRQVRRIRRAVERVGRAGLRLGGQNRWPLTDFADRSYPPVTSVAGREDATEVGPPAKRAVGRGDPAVRLRAEGGR